MRQRNVLPSEPGLAPPSWSSGSPTHTPSPEMPNALGLLACSSAHGMEAGRSRLDELRAGVAEDGHDGEIFPYQREMEHLFGADFGDLDVQVGQHAPLGVSEGEAATDGQTLALASTKPTREVVAHELAHVLQFALGGGNADLTSSLFGQDPAETEADAVARQAAAGHLVTIRRPATSRLHAKIRPSDIADQMVGEVFVLRASCSFGGFVFKPGTQVTVVSWDNAAHEVTVSAWWEVDVPGGGCNGPHKEKKVAQGLVDKALLKPQGTAGDGVADYSTNADETTSSIQQGDQDLQTLEKRRPEYERAGTIDSTWQPEKDRLTGLQDKRYEHLNDQLIQETMYNKFDAIIKKWAAYYVAEFGFDPLDPNLVKSLLFEESKMGTDGEHLSSSGNPIKASTNVMQMVDSSGIALATMMVREPQYAGVVSRYGIGKILVDLETAKKRLQDLQKKKGLTAVEQLERDKLANQSGQNWEQFVYSYPGFSAAVSAILPRPGADGQQDSGYEFWIKAGIRWLCQKRADLGLKSWEEAVRAYNGTGPAATHYGDRVSGRAQKAKAADAAGTTYETE